MRADFRKLIELIGVGRRGRWLLLTAIGVLVGALEAVAALLIFSLVTFISGDAGTSLPVIGDVRTRFSGLSDEAFLLWAAGVVAAFFVIRGIAVIMQSYLLNRIAHNAGARLSAQLFEGYLTMPYAMHLRRNSAELIRNSYTSVTYVATLGFAPLAAITSESLLVLGIVGAMLIASPTATMLAIAVLGPTVLLLVRGLQKTMTRLGDVNQEMSRSALQALQEGLHNVRDIKILGRESYFEGRFALKRYRLAQATYARAFLGDVPRVATETLLVLFLLVFIALSIRGGRDVGDAMAVLGLFAYAGLRLLPSLSRIVGHLNNIKFARASTEDVYREIKMFEASSKEASNGDEGAALPFGHQIVVDDVSMRFEGERNLALDHVTLGIELGEFVGLIGPTGSGKSTLADIVMGLLHPTDGRVVVDGVDIRGRTRGWQRNLGVVPQSTFLIDDTLRRNVALGIPEEEIDDDKLQTSVHLAQLDAFIQSLPDGLETLVGERGLRLSGGQRQRVAIARALYRQPRVLIFDEATAALDNLTESELIAGLETLHGDRTIMMIAHRLTTLRHCDRIIVLDDGRIVDEGTFSELMTRNALFRELST